MIVPNEARAQRKLAQIGYYRLSGFWYPCRKGKVDESGAYVKDPATKLPVREDNFQDGTNFDQIIELYLFDKKLRQLMLDAIERIEIHIRSVIAHEMGYFDPLAYQEASFIHPKVIADSTNKKGVAINHWGEWLKKQEDLIRRTKDDCIIWHKKNNKSIPFWVAVETWDFGVMSKYFANLKGKYQEIICERLNISNKKILAGWLDTLNLLRNRCAHHARIWNWSSANAINVFDAAYFQKLNLDLAARKRLYGLICVTWYLVKKIGPSSTWINDVAFLIDNKPDIDCCPNSAMGFPDNSGFPMEKFS